MQPRWKLKEQKLVLPPARRSRAIPGKQAGEPLYVSRAWSTCSYPELPNSLNSGICLKSCRDSNSASGYIPSVKTVGSSG